MNNQSSAAPSPETNAFDNEANFLSAMGNAKRLHILHLLAEGEMSVSVLADEVGLSQSSTSQHLAILREQELVQTRRAAQTIYYSLQSAAATAMLDTLADIFGWHRRTDVECARTVLT
ncbi:ArsR family transcriptional regulator (plasmid) [Rhizobium ruizarguesonis]|uniref:ArsR family transcriptional regulator n=1 Tax=Rhizobium ruizarguesonis TaxID=2081791 RepID=A0AAE4YPL0_9HYPH|nr:metalloregulator ArsR/SmtB family transcription factor [Rhizobium ruizarguesonis]MBY5803177.1 winged helix-turn-helix transcriptional regulator [Rhizobium leguminosarum]NKL14513.1 metalloregulator ArsR/SmtB family transcription factor [Rhizobium leguminosarum bv. viciae]QIO48005.1 winged helix-turn-helix transcriptional regulator [Rhizobium leguminosarum bv. trifolii]MBC2808820.1 winged helix-turn-helix transcriptional regulator [Rhizobium ruizarguesonis]MBY5829620.1 winged helix-turn-helix